jgi:hypothetical protein
MLVAVRRRRCLDLLLLVVAWHVSVRWWARAADADVLLLDRSRHVWRACAVGPLFVAGVDRRGSA